MKREAADDIIQEATAGVSALHAGGAESVRVFGLAGTERPTGKHERPFDSLLYNTERFTRTYWSIDKQICARLEVVPWLRKARSTVGLWNTLLYS
ncbi:MAG: hypothetical protein JRN28_01870 [Nitrososphaerota archaeon]|nr:hypothetical protein [Nitrososphaerota archaeon]